MRRRFITLDVFTRKRFAGNPLGMVLDAEGLGADAMQTIAREFGHPETVFMLPPQGAGHKAAMRIFTPASELPFAGHPTVGAAVGLARAAGSDGEIRFVIEEKVGPVECIARMHDAVSGFAEFKLPQLPKRIGDLPDAAAMAAALSLEVSDIDNAAYTPGRWSAGVAFSMVPVRSLAAAGRARPAGSFEKTFGIEGPAMVYIICSQTADPGHDVHARMFAPVRGIAEDPATGSAVAAFAGLHVAQNRPPDGRHTLAIEQGYEMGRPSQMRLSLTVSGGVLREASIGGDAVLVTEGMIEA